MRGWASPLRIGASAGLPRPVSERGQASVELVVGGVALLIAGLALFQVLAAGRMSAIADGAAEAAAIAVVNGRDPEEAARAAAPGWARGGMRVRERGGRVTVTLAAPADPARRARARSASRRRRPCARRASDVRRRGARSPSSSSPRRPAGTGRARPAHCRSTSR